jgi:hypothetical protein
MTDSPTLPVAIDLPKFTRLDPTAGWSRELVLRTDRRTVEVCELVGNGRPERIWSGIDPVLADLPLDLADGSRIAAYLGSERAQTLLSGLCGDGTLDPESEEWDDARDELNGAVLAECDESPKYWDADDFFNYALADEIFGLGFDGADAALEKRAHDLAAEAAQDGQRLVVSEVRDYVQRLWTDATAAVRDDLTDDDAELFVEMDSGEWTMDDLAACVRDGRRSLSPVAIRAVLQQRLAARTVSP